MHRKQVDLKVIADVAVDIILPTVVEKVFGPRQIVETEFRIGIQRNSIYDESASHDLDANKELARCNLQMK